MTICSFEPNNNLEVSFLSPFQESKAQDPLQTHSLKVDLLAIFDNEECIDNLDAWLNLIVVTEHNLLQEAQTDLLGQLPIIEA